MCLEHFEQPTCSPKLKVLLYGMYNADEICVECT
jgi:hypothetical protein